jgi:hypothetical protein
MMMIFFLLFFCRQIPASFILPDNLKLQAKVKKLEVELLALQSTAESDDSMGEEDRSSLKRKRRNSQRAPLKSIDVNTTNQSLTKFDQKRSSSTETQMVKFQLNMNFSFVRSFNMHTMIT